MSRNDWMIIAALLVLIIVGMFGGHVDLRLGQE